ncbi:hypothetical protein L516_4732 [Bordetella bronchiseptica MBORD668]|nr:hypothetical protein L516_4732 [Bordetella bronchiseptica MBORD668]
MMRPLMGNLAQIRRDELLNLIRRAERDQYSPPAPGKRRAIPLTMQTT